jgi:hypothetical protein
MAMHNSTARVYKIRVLYFLKIYYKWQPRFSRLWLWRVLHSGMTTQHHITSHNPVIFTKEFNNSGIGLHCGRIILKILVCEGFATRIKWTVNVSCGIWCENFLYICWNRIHADTIDSLRTFHLFTRLYIEIHSHLHHVPSEYLPVRRSFSVLLSVSLREWKLWTGMQDSGSATGKCSRLVPAWANFLAREERNAICKECRTMKEKESDALLRYNRAGIGPALVGGTFWIIAGGWTRICWPRISLVPAWASLWVRIMWKSGPYHTQNSYISRHQGQFLYRIMLFLWVVLRRCHCLDYIASSGRMMGELERIWKEAVVASSR